MEQSSLQSAEARVAAQRCPTTLSERFENRRVNHALEERISRLIEGLRRRSEAIARVVHAGAVMVERLAAFARRRSTKRETEAEYWARAQGAGEEFVPVRDQVESQQQVRTKGRGR
jgi:sarcosine oxidase delta subunit